MLAQQESHACQPWSMGPSAPGTCIAATPTVLQVHAAVLMHLQGSGKGGWRVTRHVFRHACDAWAHSAPCHTGSAHLQDGDPVWQQVPSAPDGLARLHFLQHDTCDDAWQRGSVGKLHQLWLQACAGQPASLVGQHWCSPRMKGGPPGLASGSNWTAARIGGGWWGAARVCRMPARCCRPCQHRRECGQQHLPATA